ncbi:hypothetical protein [Scytonema sp. PCC 10023]|uniref:hypothetical protein n=1 Tax=Scytonema sp. PCC 10023 TaxID=1680591 RepID=UPI0039C63D9E
MEERSNPSTSVADNPSATSNTPTTSTPERIVEATGWVLNEKRKAKGSILVI